MNKNLKRFADFLKKTVIEETEETYELGLDEIINPMDSLKDPSYLCTSISVQNEDISLNVIETVDTQECMFLIEIDSNDGSKKIYYPYDENTFNLIIWGE